MTVAVEPDTRGIDALSGTLDDGVDMPTIIWDQMVTELGDMPERPHIEPFDEEPWRKLPTLEELSLPWGASPIFMLMGDIVSRLDVEDVPKFLAEQRFMAEIELAWLRQAEHIEKEAQDGISGRQAFDGSGSGEDEPVGAAGACRGGAAVPGGSEDGDTVGEGGQASGGSDAGGASQVPRRCRPGKTGRRRGVVGEPDAAEDTQAAAAPEGDNGVVSGVGGSDGGGSGGDVHVAG